MDLLEDFLRLPDDFQGLNPNQALRNYQRNLPHWRQEGATYFLTFRLQDAVPLHIQAEIKAENIEWQKRLQRILDLSSEHQQDLEEGYQAFLIRKYRKCETTMDEGHGSCLLRDTATRKIVSNALLHFHKDRYEMHGFVVMPNHVHLAVKPLGQWEPEKLLHSWKSFASHELNKLLKRSGPLWQEDSWNRIVRDAEHWYRVMRYIMRNPGKAKLLQQQSTVWVWDAVLDSACSKFEEGTGDEEPW